MLWCWAECAAQALPDAPSATIARPGALNFAGSPVRNLQQSRTAEPPAEIALTDGQKFKVFVSHAQSPLMFAGAGTNAALTRSRGQHRSALELAT